MKVLFILGLLFTNPSIHLSERITISNNEETIAVVNPGDFSIQWFGYPIMNETMLDALTKQLAKQVFKKPVNAGIDDYGKIIPEQVGYQLDQNKFKEQFLPLVFNQKNAILNVPTIPLYPKVDSEIISMIKSRLIGHYITFYNSRNHERSRNIDLAARAINNHVVFPGETFSFNQVVGRRTTDKGYLSAPIIVRGELSEGIGGGICQVSSTLYNAVDRSGLKIIERYSHSKQVPYVPPGRDATVSWYGPDFSFKNNYNQPILIRSKSINGKMVVLIYSSDEINIEKKKVPSMYRVTPLPEQAV